MLPYKNFSIFLAKHLMLAGALVLIFLLAFSFLIRDKDFNKTTGAQNLEATYHMLLTIKALKANPIENHWLLPTVTLGRKLDKHIPWGITTPTQAGNYIYTSFTPPGFLAPYFAFGILHIEPSTKNLARFNFLLGSLVSLVLYALLIKLLEYGGYSYKTAVGGAILGVIISIFSREALQPHGLVYWSQSLYQLALALSLYLLFAYLSSENENDRKRYAAYLIIVVFLGAWIEWTGYVFGAGLAILFWFGILLDNPKRTLSIKLILALLFAALLTLVHYGLVIGFDTILRALYSRFLIRSTANSANLSLLLNHYVLSFGLFIPVVIIALSSSFFLEKDNKESISKKKKAAFLFLAATIPLIENFILLQHATRFSFDRLKFIFPAAIIISVTFARQSNFWKIVLSLALMLASFQGYTSYRADLSYYRSWATMDSKNTSLINAVSKTTNIKCSVILSNVGVKGYTNNLLDRSVYQKKTYSESRELLIKSKACAAIYLEGVLDFPDLPYYKKAIITQSNGSITSLEPLEIDSADKAFFLTNANWENGVARNWPGFLVPNINRVKEQLVVGKDLIFRNGDIRKIIEIKNSGNYLNVYLDGKVLNTAAVGRPSSYFIRSNLTSSP